MKIKIENWKKKPVIQDVQEYVEEALDGADYETGQLEATVTSVRNAHRAIGALLNILSEKGVLSAVDVSRIARGFSDEEEFVTDEEGGTQ